MNLTLLCSCQANIVKQGYPYLNHALKNSLRVSEIPLGADKSAPTASVGPD